MKKSMVWTAVVILTLGVSIVKSEALDITKDTVWTAATYVMTNNLIIKNSAKLTILPGATVKFSSDGLLWVQDGALDASGVTFTWADEVNEWQGISLGSPAAGNRLEDCVIEHAKGRSGAMVYASASSAAPGEPRIIGCMIGNGSAPQGIHVRGATAQILNNIISGFSDCGVYVYSTSINATVSGNQFQDNAAGVHIQYSSNSSPAVTGNTYSGNTEADLRIGFNTIAITVPVNWNEAPGTIYKITNGLSFADTGSFSISDGIIVELAADELIWMQGGFLDAVGVTFTWADEGSEWQGISLGSSAAGHLEDCVIEHAKGRSGAMVYADASSAAPGEPRIIGCMIGNGSAPQGIHVRGATAQILNNTISGFSEYGIYLDGSSAALVAGNLITGNRRGIGAFIQSNSVVSRVNRIEGNTEYGFFTGESYIYSVADARYNWWGSSSRPTESVGNPSGTGDPVSAKVDYIPWAGSIADTDDDGMWDAWEVDQFTDTGTATAISDNDLDGLLDKDEFLFGTDPQNKDTDDDGVLDGLEVQIGANPSISGDYMFDSDGDGYSNLREEISGTDPYNGEDIPLVLADGDPLPSGDGDVDGEDLTGLISEFGLVHCPACNYDIDTDGDVDLADLFLFSEDFGRTAMPY